MFRRRNIPSHGTHPFEITGPHSAKSSSAPKTMRPLPQPYLVVLSPVSISKQDRPLSGYSLFLRTSMPTNKGVFRDTTWMFRCRNSPSSRPERLLFRYRNTVKIDNDTGVSKNPHHLGPPLLRPHPMSAVCFDVETPTTTLQNGGAVIPDLNFDIETPKESDRGVVGFPIGWHYH